MPRPPRIDFATPYITSPDATGRAIGLHYGIGSSAIGTIHRRLARKPETLAVVESLAQKLKCKKTKCKA